MRFSGEGHCPFPASSILFLERPVATLRRSCAGRTSSSPWSFPTGPLSDPRRGDRHQGGLGRECRDLLCRAPGEQWSALGHLALGHAGRSDVGGRVHHVAKHLGGRGSSLLLERDDLHDRPAPLRRKLARTGTVRDRLPRLRPLDRGSLRSGGFASQHFRQHRDLRRALATCAPCRQGVSSQVVRPGTADSSVGAEKVETP